MAKRHKGFAVKGAAMHEKHHKTKKHRSGKRIHKR